MFVKLYAAYLLELKLRKAKNSDDSGTRTCIYHAFFAIRF
jgi:hypothetical protein